MVSIVTGDSLGLFNTSNTGLGKDTGVDRNGESVSVNASTGDLVLQRRDEFMVGPGLDLPVLRTYNSLGTLNGSTDGDNNDGFRFSFNQRLRTVDLNNNNAEVANSNVGAGYEKILTRADGSEQHFEWDAANSEYVSKEGSGPYDTLVYLGNSYISSNGGRLLSTYDADGYLVSQTDSEAHTTLSFTRDASGLVQTIGNSQGQTLTVLYGDSGHPSNVTGLEVTSLDAQGNPVTRQRISYSYETMGDGVSQRLQSVTVDLTPEVAGDTASFTTTYTYRDANSRLITGIDQEEVYAGSTRSAKLGIEYDNTGRVTALYNGGLSAGDAVVTRFQYDVTAGTSVLAGGTIPIDPADTITQVSYGSPTDSFDPVTAYEVHNNPAGHITKLVSPQKSDGSRDVTQYSYGNADGLLSQVTDSQGHTVNYTYDSHGNLTEQWDSAGNTVKYRYANNQRIAKEVYLTPDANADGDTSDDTGPTRVTRYVYDAQDRLRFTVGGDGTVTEYRYEGSSQYEMTPSKTLLYTAQGYPVDTLSDTQDLALSDLQTWVGSLADASAQVTETQRDALGEVNQVSHYGQDSSGAAIGTASVTDYVYDLHGRLLQTVDAANRETTTYSYDGLDRATTVTRSDNNGVETARVTQALSESGVRTTVDANGLRQSTISDARGLTTYSLDIQGDSYFNGYFGLNGGTILAEETRIYDSQGREIGRSNADGDVTVTFYNALGQVQATVDSRGFATEYVYNGNGQVVERIQRSNPLSSNTLDTLIQTSTSTGNTAGAITTLTGVTETTYGALGVTANATGDRDEHWVYDSAGRERFHIDGEGYVTETVYDGSGAVTQTIAHAQAYTGSSYTETDLAAFYADPANQSADDRTTRNYYDAAGRLQATVDGEGYVTEHVYNRAGQAVETIAYATASSDPQSASYVRPTADAANDQHTYTVYDGQGRRIAQVDAEGYLTTWGYNADGQVTTQTQYAQPDAGQRIAIAAGSDATLFNASTVQGWVSQAAGGANDRVTRYGYDAFGELSWDFAENSGLGHQYSYTAQGQLQKTVSGQAVYDSGTDSISFDTSQDPTRYSAQWRDLEGRVIQSETQHTQDSGSSGTVYTYDTAGRCILKTDALDHKTYYFYDTKGELTYRVQEVTEGGQLVGVVTKYKYNAAGQQILQVDAREVIDASGLSQLESAADGKEATFKGLTLVTFSVTTDSETFTMYDRRGLAVDTWDPTAFARAYANYLAQGTASWTDGTVPTAHREYNAFGEVTSLVQAIRAANTGGSVDTRTTYNSYDHRGLQTSQEVSGSNTPGDSNNLASGWLYDAFGRVIYAADANGGVTQYSYDRLGRQLSVTTGDNSLALTLPFYAYDGYQQLNDSRTTTTTYDAFDRVLTRQVGSALTATSYDDASRSLTTTQSPDGGTTLITTTTTRNAFGETVKVMDGNYDWTEYTYDTDGNLTETSRYGADGTETAQTVSEYDAMNQQIYRWEGVGADQVATSYQYDALKRLIKVVKDDGGLNLTTTYQHDTATNTLTETDADGRVTQSTFDESGRLSRVVVDPGGLNLVTDYSYDIEGLKVKEQHGVLVSGSAVYQRTVSYQYDAYGRRESETVDPGGLNLTTAYGYDKQGNVTSRTDANLVQTEYFYNQHNERIAQVVHTAGGDQYTTYRHDSQGRVTDVLVYATGVFPWTFDGNSAPAPLSHTRNVYDDLGRLTATIDSDGHVVENVYDAVGRLVATKAYANAIDPETQTVADVVADPSRDEETRYVYDASGRQRFVLDAEGHLTENRYDTRGNVIEHRVYGYALDLTGLSDAVGLSDAGFMAVLSAAFGTVRDTQSVYDAADRKRYVLDAEGYLTERCYDGVGQVVKEIAYSAPFTAAILSNPPGTIGADDRVTYHFYDASGRERYTVDGEGYVTEHRYDDVANTRTAIQYADPYTVAAGETTASLASKLPASPDAGTDPETVDTYDAAGRLAGTVDAAGNTTVHVYDGVGRETDTTVASGTSEASTTHRVYDDLGHLVEETQASGSGDAATTRYVVDALGRRTAIIDPRGVELAESDSEWAMNTRQAMGFATHAADLTTADQAKLEALYTTTQSFDGEGHVKQVQSPSTLADPTQGPSSALVPGATIDTEYDAFGNAVKVTDQRGNSGYFYFDLNNQLVLQVDPGGYVTQTEYNGFGDTHIITLYANAVQGGTVNVDTPPALVSSAPATGPYVLTDASKDQTTTIEHDLRGLQTSISNAENYTESMTYNAFGDKATYTNQAQGLYTYTYDHKGNVLTETSPTVAVYTGGTLQSLGLVTGYTYDARGNVKTITQAQGLPEARVTTYSYDLLNRQTAKSGEAFTGYDAAQGTTVTETPNETQQYDARGNLIESTDAAGNRTLYYYDARNRKIAQLSPLGQLTTWEYNDGSKPIAEHRYSQAVTLPATAGDFTQVTVPTNDTGEQDIEYTYDANNRLLTTTQRHQLVGEQTAGQSTYTLAYQDVTVTQTYDATGNVIQVTDGRGNNTHYYYDSLGRKTMQVDAGNYVTQWSYDNAGNVTRETHYATALAAGTDLTAAPTPPVNNPADGQDRVTVYTYDRLNQVKSKAVQDVDYGDVNTSNGQLTAQSGGTALDSYVYDGLGNVVQHTQQVRSGDSMVSDFSYDAMSRLQEAQKPSFTDYNGDTVRPTTDYQYDGLGQKTQEIDRGTDPNTTSDDHITTYVYDYANQGGRLSQSIDAEGAVTAYDYDANGNITRKTLQGRVVNDSSDPVANGSTTTDDTVEYRYNAANQEVWHRDVSSGEIRETRYNVFGQVTGKRLTSDGASPSVPYQETTDYDSAGHIWRSNSGDGVYKIYVYDANGNTTLTIASTGGDLNAASIQKAEDALALTDTSETVSHYDARNLLTDTYQEQGNVNQFITQKVQNDFSAGAISVGPDALLPKDNAPDPSVSLPIQDLGLGSVQMWLASPTNTSSGRFTVAFPDLSGLGTGNVRVEFSAYYNSTYGSYTDGPYSKSVSSGATSVVFNQTVVEYAGNVAPLTSVTVTLYVTRSSGDEVPVFTTTKPVSATTLFDLSNYGNIDWPLGSAKMSLATISDPSETADRAVLEYRTAGSSGGWSQQLLTLERPGHFSFDYSTLTGSTTYEFRCMLLDSSGNEVRCQAGTMTPTSSELQIEQVPLENNGSGSGRAFVDSNGLLNVVNLGADAQSLKLSYRVKGSTDWLPAQPITLSPAQISGENTPGWFIFDAQSEGLAANDYQFKIEALNADPTPAVVNTAEGTFTVDSQGKISAAPENLTDVNSTFTVSGATDPVVKTSGSATLSIYNTGIPGGSIPMTYYDVTVNNVDVPASNTTLHVTVVTEGNVAGGVNPATGQPFNPTTLLEADVLPGSGTSLTGQTVRIPWEELAYYDVRLQIQADTPNGSVLVSNQLIQYPQHLLDGLSSPPFLADGDTWSSSFPYDLYSDVTFGNQPAGTTDMVLITRPVGDPNGSWTVVTSSGSSLPWSIDQWPSDFNEFRYWALDASGNVLNAQAGTMRVDDTTTPAVITAGAVPQIIGGAGDVFMDSAGALNFIDQGKDPQSMTIQYRKSGSTGAWSAPVTANAGSVGNGWFTFDPSAEGLSGQYDYLIEATNGSGTVVNRATGSFISGQPGSVTSLRSVSDDALNIVNFSGQPVNAATMVLQYKVDGSADAWTSVTLTPDIYGIFRWDASDLPADTYAFQYTIKDANGNPINSDVNGITATGKVTFGTAPQVLQHLASTASAAIAPDSWTIAGLTNTDVQHRSQAHNAFGEVSRETDGLGRVTELSYNTLGLLTEKKDPQTNATLENGYIERLNPTTTYTYDLAGRLVGTTDANGNITTRMLLDGTGTGGQGNEAKVIQETYFEPNGTTDLQYRGNQFDVFGNARRLIVGATEDPQNPGSAGHVRITEQDFDKLGHVTEIRHPDTVYSNGNGVTFWSGVDMLNYDQIFTQYTFDRYTYDQAGNQVSHTKGAVADLNGDGIYQAGESKDIGTEWTYYDSLGRVIQHKSFAGADTFYDYTFDSSIVGLAGAEIGGYSLTTADPSGHSSVDDKDYFGRLTEHVDLGGHDYTYTYNNAGWLTGQTSTAGQNIGYDYYGNGLIKSIHDYSENTVTAYAYDVEGNRTMELYGQVQPGTTTLSKLYQNSAVTYDALNRVQEIRNGLTDIKYEYDANGNVRRVFSSYADPVNGSPQIQDYWYAYDAMNRFTTTMGTFTGGTGENINRGADANDTSYGITIDNSVEGVAITYDEFSDRATATYANGGNTYAERYTYSGNGDLQDTFYASGTDLQNAYIVARRRMDAYNQTGYEYQFTSAGEFSRTKTLYDADNRVTINETDSLNHDVTTVTYYYQSAGGPLSSTFNEYYSESSGTGTVTDMITSYTYEWWDNPETSTIETQVVGNPAWQPGYSVFSYDINGHLREVDDIVGNRIIKFNLNAQGLILSRNEYAGTNLDIFHNYLYFDGHMVGDIGNDNARKPTYTDDVVGTMQALANKNKGSNKPEDRYKNWRPISSVNFDQNYQPINSDYPAMVPGSYIVQSGDSLQSIAGSLWGDSSLWYLLADANGLNADDTLTPGRTLTVPNRVTNIHNNSQTHAVYDPGRIIGDTSPTLPEPPPPPKPKHQGCGVKQIVVVVIAVIVTIYTCGAASMGLSAALNAGFSATMSTGLSALAGTAVAGAAGLSSVSASIVGGAVGSIVSQGVGMALGVQHGFSWSNVAMSAIGAGAGAGIGELANTGTAGFSAFNGSNFMPTVGRATIGNIATQEIEVATGLQEKFSWRQVASSAVGSAASWGVNDIIGKAEYGSDWNLSKGGAANSASVNVVKQGMFRNIVRGTATGLVAGGVQSALSHQKPNWGLIAANSFGNALGNAVANQAAFAEEQRAQMEIENKNLQKMQAEMGKSTLKPTMGKMWQATHSSEQKNKPWAALGSVPALDFSFDGINGSQIVENGLLVQGAADYMGGALSNREQSLRDWAVQFEKAASASADIKLAGQRQSDLLGQLQWNANESVFHHGVNFSKEDALYGAEMATFNRYGQNTRATVRALGGAIEAVGGIFGGPLGWAGSLYGLDQMQAGIRTLTTGEETNSIVYTGTFSLARSAGATYDQANTAASVTEFTLGMGIGIAQGVSLSRLGEEGPNKISSVNQPGLSRIPLERTQGLGANSTTSELLSSGAIPGRQGVILDQRTVPFDDVWQMSQNSGVEFILTRENGQFVLRSGSATSAPIKSGVRPIVHTHPTDEFGVNSLLPSNADINVLNALWARNPNGARPVSQILTGQEQPTRFFATGIEQLPTKR